METTSCWFLLGFESRTSTHRPVWSQLHHPIMPSSRGGHKRQQTADLQPVQRIMGIFDVVPSDRDQCLARRCSVPGNEISGKTQSSGYTLSRPTISTGPRSQGRDMQNAPLCCSVPLASFAAWTRRARRPEGRKREAQMFGKGPHRAWTIYPRRVCMNDVARRPRKVSLFVVPARRVVVHSAHSQQHSVAGLSH